MALLPLYGVCDSCLLYLSMLLSVEGESVCTVYLRTCYFSLFCHLNIMYISIHTYLYQLTGMGVFCGSGVWGMLILIACL